MELIELLKQAVKSHASDLHLSPGSPPILRINGALAVIENQPILTKEDIKQFLQSIMSQEQITKFNDTHDLDFSMAVKMLGSFRVNAFQQLNGPALVFRVVPEKIPTLDELKTPKIFERLLELSNGLILVTGPTGCGKSTTLAAMINYINARHASHVITIEDPIEFIHQNQKCLIDQRQVERDTYNFSTALRAALREDPDVILVGEMRDLETIRLALTAAETGHLVLATLHTSSAPRSINRMIDVFPTNEKNIIRNLISESLQAVICQSLVIAENNSRMAAFEVMVGTTAIRNLIREDKTAQMYSVMQTGGEHGMCTMDQYLRELVNKHLISEDALQQNTLHRELV